MTPNHTARFGYQFFQEAINFGAYLKPIGNTLYWLPPLIIEESVLDKLKLITLKTIQACA
jgi:adenosylmethionine-8-amino-7-oxononanoate aminotransferase